jgi:hypothetical protein
MMGQHDRSEPCSTTFDWKIRFLKGCLSSIHLPSIKNASLSEIILSLLIPECGIHEAKFWAEKLTAV